MNHMTLYVWIKTVQTTLINKWSTLVSEQAN